MFITNLKDFKEIIISKDLPLELKVYIFEGDFSELAYRLWCRISGGKFERRQKKKQNTCRLVTKRGLHLFSSLIGRLKSSSITPLELEVYERNCPGSRWGTTTMYWYRWFETDSKCMDCGKPYKVQEDDVKIVGKF